MEEEKAFVKWRCNGGCIHRWHHPTPLSYLKQIPCPFYGADLTCNTSSLQEPQAEIYTEFVQHHMTKWLTKLMQSVLQTNCLKLYINTGGSP